MTERSGGRSPTVVGTGGAYIVLTRAAEPFSALIGLVRRFTPSEPGEG